MLEVELKYRIDSRAGIEERLANSGAAHIGQRFEIDIYFNAPDRDFAQTDEALRIRSIGDRNILTYKGPKIDAQTKTRKEIETELQPGETARGQMWDVLLALGYRPVAEVQKSRDLYELSKNGFPIGISIDDVAKLGLYAEIEIVVNDDDLDTARDTVLDLAHSFGFGQSERRSYLELIL